MSAVSTMPNSSSTPCESASSSQSQQCGICGCSKREQPYKCPRCSLLYCTIRCYRNEKHSKCSEKFYQEQVKLELSGKTADMSSKGEDYREKMQKFLDGDWSDVEGGEPLDSDDDAEPEDVNKWRREADEAVRKTIESTIEDYELDDEEVDRRMTAMGLSEDVDELLGTLTPDEREIFRKLAEEIQDEELGLDSSCFPGQKSNIQK